MADLSFAKSNVRATRKRTEGSGSLSNFLTACTWSSCPAKASPAMTAHGEAVAERGGQFTLRLVVALRRCSHGANFVGD